MAQVGVPLRRLLRPGDWAVFAIACAVAAGSHWLGRSHDPAQAGGSVIVEVAGHPAGRWRMAERGSLRRDTVQALKGPMVLETTERSVRVIASSCPDHWCEREAPLMGPGGALICLPNRLIVRMDGGTRLAAVHAITQ